VDYALDRTILNTRTRFVLCFASGYHLFAVFAGRTLFATVQIFVATKQELGRDLREPFLGLLRLEFLPSSWSF